MKHVSGSGGIAPPFFSSALYEGEWPASRPGCSAPGERAPGTQFDMRLGGPKSRSGRCGVQKNLLPLPGIEPQPSSPSLYQLSYPGSLGDYLSIYGSTVLLLDLGLFFSFLILYTVGRIPWSGDQPVARPLPTHRTAQTRNERMHTCMP
jgi:hypothetical protein